MKRTSAMLLTVVFLLTAFSLGQENPTKLIHQEVQGDNVYGRTALAIPSGTDAGTWSGTWTYISRDHRFALWLDERDGKTIAKIRYAANGRVNEDFETDWSGSADYTVQNLPAKFDFKIVEAGKSEMTVEWVWDLDFRGSARREKGLVDVYRTGDGRQIVMHFKEFERVFESDGRAMRNNSPQSWTFTKRSRRLVRWEELPL